VKNGKLPNLTSPYVLDQQVGHLLRRANQRHAALFAERFANSGLTPLQFAALMKLAEVGEVSQNRLGRLTAMDPNTIQGVVQRLTRRALVERRPHPEDRRRVNLALTTEGTTLAGNLVADGLGISTQTLQPLSATERAIFVRLLQKLT
jgi:MarR family transcriptional regulator, lower aerobic nicotinate degradation pathway regulator